MTRRVYPTLRPADARTAAMNGNPFRQEPLSLRIIKAIIAHLNQPASLRFQFCWVAFMFTAFTAYILIGARCDRRPAAPLKPGQHFVQPGERPFDMH